LGRIAATHFEGTFVNRQGIALLISFAVVLGGCAVAHNGGSTSGVTAPGPTPTQPFALTLTPGTASVRGGTTQQYAAKTNDGTSPAFSWAVNGIAGGGPDTGTISASGLYTAAQFPPATGPVTVTVSETADAQKTANATLTLQNPVPQITAVTPAPIDIGPFTLTVTGSMFAQGATVFFGDTALTTTWISPTQLSAMGAATTSQVGSVSITVQNPAPGAVSSAPYTVQVTAPNPNISVTVTPATAMVGAGNLAQFIATVTNTTDLSVGWAVNSITGGNNTVGFIDSNGIYTGPDTIPASNTVTITATSLANPAKSGSAVVTLQNPIPVLTSITPAQLGTGPFQITLYGTGFVYTSTATFGGAPLSVTYVTSTMITAIGTVSPSQAGTSVSVIVTNPGPGGGTSGAISEQVLNTGAPVSAAAADRFLEQSSFGPDPETLDQLQQTGFDIYLQNQFASTVTPFTPPLQKSTVYDLQNNFFLNMIAGGDQLRERVAFALNEMWVVGADKVGDPVGYTNYLNTLNKDALGNYLSLMTDITLTPAMGNYLDMVNNDAPAPGQHANENYARELMQLFCLGLNQLNPDGTPVLDASGNPIPTYTQDDVMALGRAFTGWTYPVTPGKSSQTHNAEYYGGNMVPVESNHDMGAKTLLGQAIPAGQTAEADLTSMLAIIFNHPNVGPFVSQQLIEKLVTSNPSPAYVQRVAQAFNTGKFNAYGSGNRGDMQATVAAILLDPEARRGDSSATVVAGDGKLREPIVMEVAIARAFHARTDAHGLPYESDQMSQNVFFPPTVFNFFPPVNPISGTTLNGPEFAIFNTNTSLARANFVDDVVYGAIGSNTKLDFSPVYNAGTPSQMLDWLGTLFLHGAVPDSMAQTITTAINAVDPTDTHGQAKTAIYLVTSSSMYQVQH
jgi:uncharacterized protein (DUF1800 family)